ncbi:hypothetical protein DEB41_17655 (plasmid) [Vibrio anguillarum]|uniref:Uncharacterized protein n=4 Tax=Vibrio anguillarum TaxID=55601 RepID=A0A3M7LLK3_VIBAN|nr:hypothetical protein [Vibrio anguillarum]AGU59985.1 hypothetical protein N175_19500 [Vibrio anguillarum M3]AAR12551.1 hypothetical protein [Vibrio anguillarum 775]ATA51737.1 hypothetical protein CLI14_18920 [Vibrio anguillarum]AVT65638.1 hypothetical protein B5S57_00055 [Vibrio anguillarum]AXN09326.1 hypothetical protein DEA53_17860 [Vibrio anguillarum]
MCEMTEEQLRLVEHYCLTATYENIKADFLSLCQLHDNSWPAELERFDLQETFFKLLASPTEKTARQEYLELIQHSLEYGWSKVGKARLTVPDVHALYAKYCFL